MLHAADAITSETSGPITTDHHPSAGGVRSSGVAAAAPASSGRCDPTRSRFAPFAECPHCGGSMAAEHAHFRCGGCGWRDSCCD